MSFPSNLIKLINLTARVTSFTRMQGYYVRPITSLKRSHPDRLLITKAISNNKNYTKKSIAEEVIPTKQPHMRKRKYARPYFGVDTSKSGYRRRRPSGSMRQDRREDFSGKSLYRSQYQYHSNQDEQDVPVPTLEQIRMDQHLSAIQKNRQEPIQEIKTVEAPRLDNMYYKPTDMRKRRYMQTWSEYADDEIKVDEIESEQQEVPADTPYRFIWPTLYNTPSLPKKSGEDSSETAATEEHQQRMRDLKDDSNLKDMEGISKHLMLPVHEQKESNKKMIAWHQSEEAADSPHISSITAYNPQSYKMAEENPEQATKSTKKSKRARKQQKSANAPSTIKTIRGVTPSPTFKVQVNSRPKRMLVKRKFRSMCGVESDFKSSGPRFDDLFYKPTELKKREYSQTWIDYQEPKKVVLKNSFAKIDM